MLLSFALLLLLGMSLGKIFEQVRLPKLIGMLFTGIILGPYALNLLAPSLLGISTDLRQLALIIILARCGLNLNMEDLKRVGRPAILLCFVPACFEIVAITIFAPLVFDITYLDAVIMGTVLSAVSPAVIVPRMIKLMDEGYGNSKSIPQMVMAGASCDDVFVIVLFTVFTSLADGGTLSALSFLNIPLSVFLGITCGVIIGFASAFLFSKLHMRDSHKVLILLSISFLLVSLEEFLKPYFGFSGLIAIMAMGIIIQQKRPKLSKRLSLKFSKLWVFAEIILFVLVGATVDISFALSAGLMSVAIIFIGLFFRSIGVLMCLLKTNLTKNERIFTTIAYMPKATVQAAIGGIPLAMGLACGNLVLTVAVVSILITAPLGAILIDSLYSKLLIKD